MHACLHAGGRAQCTMWFAPAPGKSRWRQKLQCLQARHAAPLGLNPELQIARSVLICHRPAAQHTPQGAAVMASALPGCLQVLRLWPAGSRQTPEDCRSAAIYMSCVRTAQEGQGLALCLCQPWNCPKSLSDHADAAIILHQLPPHNDKSCGPPERSQFPCSQSSLMPGGTCAAKLGPCRLVAGRCQRGAVCCPAPEHPQQPRRHHAFQGLPLLLAPQLQHCMGQEALL